MVRAFSFTVPQGAVEPLLAAGPGAPYPLDAIRAAVGDITLDLTPELNPPRSRKPPEECCPASPPFHPDHGRPRPRPPRRHTIPLFDHYLFADYSGSGTNDTPQAGLVVYQASRKGDPNGSHRLQAPNGRGTCSANLSFSSASAPNTGPPGCCSGSIIPFPGLWPCGGWPVWRTCPGGRLSNDWMEETVRGRRWGCPPVSAGLQPLRRKRCFFRPD